MLHAVLHYANSIAKHGKQLRQRNQNLQSRQNLKPMQGLHLNFRGCLLESYRDEIVHRSCVVVHRIENLTQHNFQLRKLLLRHIIGDCLHPMRHDRFPNLIGDDVVRDEANEPLQTLLQMLRSRCERVPMAADSRVLRRMWKQAGNELLGVRNGKFPQPSANVIHLELLQSAFDSTFGRISGDVEPVEKHVQKSSDNLDWCIDGWRTSTDQQPNAILAQLLTIFKRDVVVRSTFRVCCVARQVQVQRLRFAQQTDDGFDHVARRLQIHLPSRQQRPMEDVIHSALSVVSS